MNGMNNVSSSNMNNVSSTANNVSSTANNVDNTINNMGYKRNEIPYFENETTKSVNITGEELSSFDQSGKNSNSSSFYHNQPSKNHKPIISLNQQQILTNYH